MRRGRGFAFGKRVAMPLPPDTSTTLLDELAGDTQHARWGEFIKRYRPMMTSYMGVHFPTLDAEEMIQETLIALIRILPHYTYAPDEKGLFRHYLTGILRRKSLKALSRQRAEGRRLANLAAQNECEADGEEEADRAHDQQVVMELALQQLLCNKTIHGRTREVFLRVAINGEAPESVAEAFGMKRNAVDQVKARMVARLRALVKALGSLEGEEP